MSNLNLFVVKFFATVLALLLLLGFLIFKTAKTVANWELTPRIPTSEQRFIK